MNPFNVDRFVNIVLNFDYLNRSIGNREEFISNILQEVRDKFEQVNIIITTEYIPGIDNVKEVFIHNEPNISQAFQGNPGDYGTALFEEGKAQVNVDNIMNDIDFDSFDQLVQSVSTITSHESAHLLSPRAHSLYDDNLLSEHLKNSLLNDGGESLKFTTEQVQLMNWGIEAPEEMTNLIYGDQNIPISYWEQVLERQNNITETVSDSTSSFLDPELWGSFEPDLIGSVEGLRGVDNFSEIESLGELTAADISELSEFSDGILENIGDLLGEIDLEDIIDGVLNIL